MNLEKVVVKEPATKLGHIYLANFPKHKKKYYINLKHAVPSRCNETYHFKGLEIYILVHSLSKLKAWRVVLSIQLSV